MDKITIIRCDDGVIWVTSDDDAIGDEVKVDEVEDEGEQMLIALAEFLGFEPSELLNF